MIAQPKDEHHSVSQRFKEMSEFVYFRLGSSKLEMYQNYIEIK